MAVQKYENKDNSLTSLGLVRNFGGTQFSLLLWLISKPRNQNEHNEANKALHAVLHG